MSFLNEVLDRAISGAGLPSDSALADLLKIGRQSVSKWRMGETRPNREHIEKLSAITGVSAVVIQMGIDCDDWHPKFRREWLTAIKALSKAAALALIFVLPLSPARGTNQTNGHAERPDTLCIMRSVRRIAALITRLIHTLEDPFGMEPRHVRAPTVLA